MKKILIEFKECKNCDCRITLGINNKWYHVSPLGRFMRYTNKCTKPEPKEIFKTLKNEKKEIKIK